MSTSPATEEAVDPSAIWIDGNPYTTDDLTFGEQRIMRDLVLKNSPEDVTDPTQAADADFIPAIITVVKARETPSFTYEDALKFKPKDLEPPERPTKPAAKKKAAARR